MELEMHSMKTEQSRLNVLYIILILKKYSNEEHPISITEITDKINHDFIHLTVSNKIISSDTVKRTLETLVTYLFDTSKDSFLEEMSEYGFAIFCVMKIKGSYTSYKCVEGMKPPQKYYYYQSTFTNAEVTTLIDSIETYNYFSDDDLMEIINKLIKIQPLSYLSETYIDYDPTVKDKNSLLVLNIDDLDKIIDNRKCAKIIYCSYNYKKELVPKPGYPKIIEPFSLMWSNGYYYLVAYHPDYKSIVNYRIDRISEIEVIDQVPIHKPNNFNASYYRLEHPVMYGGTIQTVVLLCRDTGNNNIMNLIMDVFGKLVKISLATDEELCSHLGNGIDFFAAKKETWLKVSFQATLGGVELWVTQYANDCRIIYPTESVIRVKEKLEQALGYYSNV